jgi:hypothetical protein
MSAKKLTDRDFVKAFARYHGLKISPNPGDEPLIGKGDWFQVFDSWALARSFFSDASIAHVDHSVPYPWCTEHVSSLRKAIAQ